MAGVLSIAFLAGCQLKEVSNPNITDESFVGTLESSSVWLTGMNRQLSLTLNDVIPFVEIAADNYYNNSSLSNKVFDIPTILYSDLDVDNMERAIGRLQQMAEYGLNRIIPGDINATNADHAEMYFIGAYARLLSAEIYKGLPMEPNGPVVSDKDILLQAVDYLNKAIALQTDAAIKNKYTMALARAYYDMGDRVKARQAAETIINTAPTLLVSTVYDGVNNVSNTMQTYTFSNSTNTYAPLPRLDLLDPKYYHVGTLINDQKSIALLKGEEAYLILAEAMIGSDELDDARTVLKRLITEVINLRPTASVNGSQAQRKGNRSDYPLLATVKVKFDAEDDPRSGYILDRQAGNITVHTVSGTSVKEADLDAAQTEDELLYLLSLMRQEIFMSEGRRMTDLGIRFPISQVEMQNNTHIKEPDTKAVIPSYIPGNLGMDDFTYDKNAGIVTMDYDMNKVLVQHKSEANIFPMLK